MGNRARKRKLKPEKIEEKSQYELEEELYRGSEIDPNSRSYVYDEVDDFIEERERNILKLGEEFMPERKVKKQQVLGLDIGSSDEDDYEDDDDDEEGEEEEEEGEGEEDEEEDEGLSGDDEMDDEDLDDSDKEAWEMDDDDGDISGMPKFTGDERAWGKEKSAYHGTDTTDQMIHFKLYRQQEELAKLEEETARRLQNRMADELKGLESDDLIPEIKLNKDKQIEEQVEGTKADKVEVDISKLSRKKKLQLLKRESPEFLPLVEDLKIKCDEIQTFLRPLMMAIKRGFVPEGSQKDYIITKYRLMLNYVSVLSVYMMLKSSKSSVGKHPAVGRLAQYRQLLQELEICDETLGPELRELLEDIENGTAKRIKKESAKKKMKKLKLLNGQEQAEEDEEEEAHPVKKAKKGKKRNVTFVNGEEEVGTSLNPGTGKKKKRDHARKGALEYGKTLESNDKRGLNYEITKNRGLVAYRKKEHANPRVHYKKKFKKKVIKHKSQVQVMRKEINRYEGELTGIKAYTVKSQKFK